MNKNKLRYKIVMQNGHVTGLGPEFLADHWAGLTKNVVGLGFFPFQASLGPEVHRWDFVGPPRSPT